MVSGVPQEALPDHHARINHRASLGVAQNTQKGIQDHTNMPEYKYDPTETALNLLK